jgi:hypothetical protein
MSISSRYRHTLVVKRDVATAAFDALGNPVTAEFTVATVKGLIQPRTAKEVAQLSQAGPVVSDYICYMALLTGLETDCWIEYGSDRYDILSMPDAAGLGHHLELAVRMVK